MRMIQRQRSFIQANARIIGIEEAIGRKNSGVPLDGVDTGFDSSLVPGLFLVHRQKQRGHRDAFFPCP